LYKSTDAVILANKIVVKEINHQSGAFTKWKDLVDIWHLNDHSKSEYHKFSIIKFEEFIKAMENKIYIYNNTKNEVDISWKKQDIKNRAILYTIIETILLFDQQNIALRGW